MMKKDNLPSKDFSILSDCVKIEGKIISEGNVNIDGAVTGYINVNGNISIGEKALIKGTVIAENIVLMGKVEGKVQAKEKLVLEGKSYLKGDLIAKILVVEAGAKFEGQSLTAPPASNNQVKSDNK